MFIDINGDKRYKVGLHLHTTLSDGKVSPEEAASIYKKAGFDAIAITDHWKFYGEDEINGLKIMSGCEYNMGSKDTSVDVMHIVGVGMENAPKVTKSDSRQKVIDAIIEKGGMAILAHPAWSLNTTEEVMALNGISAVEIYNTVSNVNQSSRPYSGYFVDMLANKGVSYPLVATDDTHYYNGEDETKSFICVKAQSGSVKDILDAIKQENFYASQGPQLLVRQEGEKIIAHCSECIMIDFLSNAAWGEDRITRGENLTYAEYRIKEHDKWVRVEVKDKDGNYAWSNIIKV